MRRRGWWVLAALSFVVLVLPVLVLNLPRFLLEGARWVGRHAVRPSLYCRRRAQGWSKVGALWTKGERVNRRRAS